MRCLLRGYRRSYNSCNALKRNMGKTLSERLQPWREKIDAIDKQILELLNERAQAALEIGSLKQGVSEDEPILRPEREAQVISRLIELNQGPVQDGSVRSEEHTSELQSRGHLVCRLLLEKKKQST